MAANRVNLIDDPNTMKKVDILATDTSIQRHQQHQADVIHCLRNKCPNHHHQYRHRCVSVSSQATLLTTVSKNDVRTSSPSGNGADATTANRYSNGSFGKKDERTASTLTTIAEKLRRGTRKVLQFTTTTSSGVAAAAPACVNSREVKLQKDNSVESAHTNTISNSSLQEVDAEEFDSAELAKYMGEINNEIR